MVFAVNPSGCNPSTLRGRVYPSPYPRCEIYPPCVEDLTHGGWPSYICLMLLQIEFGFGFWSIFGCMVGAVWFWQFFRRSKFYCQNVHENLSKIDPNFFQNRAKIDQDRSKIDQKSVLGRLGGRFRKNDEKCLPESNFLKPLGGQVGGSCGPRWRH